VQSSLQRWLADVVEVQAVEVGNDESVLRVAVQYRIRTDAQAQTLVLTRTV
jgi:uncharacterized protein